MSDQLLQTGPQPELSRLLGAGGRIHLVGIGGAGLSAIARLLLQRGLRVSGSDQRAGPITQELAELGAAVFVGHDAAHVAGADLVLISSAVPANNPEVVAAQAAGIPVVKREQFLEALMAGHQSICVAGAHGKTTTTAMLAALLDALGAEPSFIVGSTILALGTAARAGRAGGPFVIEADEYDHMFLGLRPDIAVVTNVEWDHVDCYPNPEDFQRAFQQFTGLVRPGGAVVYCGDDPGSRSLHDGAAFGASAKHKKGVQWVSYGLQAGNQWRAENVQPRPAALDAGSSGIEFDVWREKELLGRIAMPLCGDHNVRNALAALAAATLAGYDVFSRLDENLKFSRIFAGTKRRLEIIGHQYGIIVLDDYAHHPTEVRATLGAVRQRFPRRPVWVLFQPHTYSRTKALLDEFRDSFENADHVLITDIYAAREHDTLGISALDVVRTLSNHPDARYAGDLDAATRLLLAELAPGDVLITMGAGDGDRVGRHVLAELRQRPAASPAADQRAGGMEARYAALAAAIARDTGLAVRREEPLSGHTTMRVGGPADLFVAVGAVEDLVAVIGLAREAGVPALVLGGGSNLLVSDRGVRGLVIANGCRSVRRHEGDVLWAESGANLAGVARQAMRWGLAGLEWGVSVPGTVGGAVVGNAGAHGGCVADNLLRATLLGPDGALTEWPVARFAYSYRDSALKRIIRSARPQPVVLSAAFQLQEADPTEMEARAAGFLSHRRQTQPVEPSAGSIFQNPPGDYAGRIIESLGLKGVSQGGAAFSTVHANFIVNRGGATAADVVTLINRARLAAWQDLGVALAPEILFVGEWPEQPVAELARSETGQSNVEMARSETGQSNVEMARSVPAGGSAQTGQNEGAAEVAE